MKWVVLAVDLRDGDTTTNKRESRRSDLIVSRITAREPGVTEPRSAGARGGSPEWVADPVQVGVRIAPRSDVGLQQAIRGERERLAQANDEVIQQLHVHAVQRTFQALGQSFIRG